MKKIATIALVYAIATTPAIAAEDYLASEAETAYALRNATLGKIRANADRLSTFSLLEVNSNFSLYGKLSVPRLTTGIETGMQRNAVTYGLHGQLGSMAGIGIPKMGIRFGWNRDLAGPDSSGNMYSLTAEIKF